MMQKQLIEISWGSLWKIFFFVLLATVLLLTFEVFLALFLAIVISSGLEALISYLEQQGIPRTLGVILIFLVAIVAVVITLYMLVPFIIADLTSAVDRLHSSSLNYWLDPILNIQNNQSVLVLLNRVSSSLFTGGAPFGFVSNAVGKVGLAVAVIAISFYLSLSRDGIGRFLRAVIPAKYERTALRIYRRANKQVGIWFRTQIVLSLLVGVITWAALELLGVRHAILIGILTALFELVPYIGPLIAGAAAVVVALTTSPALALYTLLVFIAIQQLESQVLVPLIMGRSVGLHPVIVIIAFLIGIQLGGFFGAFIAIPAAAVIQEVVEVLSNTRRSEEEEVERTAA